jgi:hypothetical protein
VFVIPVGPNCQSEFVSDTLDSIRWFAPLARIILVDDSLRSLGADLADHYGLTSVEARVHGLYGGLYLNLSDGFREALTQPFEILIRLDTDALIAGSDFESKAVALFQADDRLGSLGSFRIGYDCVGVRDRSWAKRQILKYLAFRALVRPQQTMMMARLVWRARKSGYKLGDGIMGGAAIYRHAAVRALDEAGLLGRVDLARSGLHEDYIFGLCLFSIGYQLGEFGNRFDDLPMGVTWQGLPASPAELMERRKSIIHSTKRFGTMDERAIREVFRAARRAGLSEET